MCNACLGTTKVMCTSCLCTGMALVTEHEYPHRSIRLIRECVHDENANKRKFYAILQLSRIILLFLSTYLHICLHTISIYRAISVVVFHLVVLPALPKTMARRPLSITKLLEQPTFRSSSKDELKDKFGPNFVVFVIAINDLSFSTTAFAKIAAKLFRIFSGFDFCSHH